MKVRLPTTRERKNGFTIIEVILVLAIAGSLMVMIFIVASQAQKSKRDVQRKSYAGSLLQAELEYLKNNWVFPGCDGCSAAGTDAQTKAAAERFIKNYMPQEDSDPLSGQPYASSSVAHGVDTSGPYVKTDSDSAYYYYDAALVRHDVKPTHPGQIIITVGHYCRGNGPVEESDVTLSGPDVDMTAIVMLMGTEKGEYYCLDNYSVK